VPDSAVVSDLDSRLAGHPVLHVIVAQRDVVPFVHRQLSQADQGAAVLDRVDLYDDFDPRRDYRLTVTSTELTDVEREARAAPATSVDDITLDE
jgi:hypothetical protein